MAWGYSPRASLVIPVKIEGSDKNFYLQFDTGTEGSFLYGDILKLCIPDIDTTLVTMEIAWYSQDSEPGSSYFPIWWRDDKNHDPGICDSGRIKIGDIGTDLLRDKILIIDYPNQRLAVFEKDDSIETYFQNDITYIPVELANNKIYLSPVLGKDTLKSVLFDTGSSEFALILPKEEWVRYAGRTGDEADVLKAEASSWGKYISIWKAPSQFDLSLGDINFRTPMISCVDIPDNSGNYGRIMGNALFYYKHLIIADFAHSRFAILTSGK